MPDDGAVTPITLTTDDGLALQAEISTVREPRAAAVLCHPHPLHGGNMHASVIGQLFNALPRIGVTCLRFNFRGVSGSEGTHGDGVEEKRDVLAALEHLASAVPTQSPWLIGWSFGADVSLAVDHERLAGWVAIAPPLRIVDPDAMVAGTDERSVHLLVPEHDQFNPPARAIETTEDWMNSQLRAVAGADHFLSTALGEINDAVGNILLAEA